MHFLTEIAVMFSCGPTQQLQASSADSAFFPMVLFRHVSVAVLKFETRVSHSEIAVLFGWGKLAVLHDLLTSTSQSNRVLVRLVSCLAPLLVVDPEQDRALLLPPPMSSRAKATEANSPFLSLLLPPCLFCFVILLF